uniref:Uncharacterized protein n=1 Tax=Arion vulgaris TaxID=1028688 RepID=A0A0B6YRB7_9EUPU
MLAKFKLSERVKVRSSWSVCVGKERQHVHGCCGALQFVFGCYGNRSDVFLSQKNEDCQDGQERKKQNPF